MSQNMAPPAPAKQKIGKDKTPTPAYWWASATSLPRIQKHEQL